MSKILSVFAERRIIITLLLGFASGLPLALSGGRYRLGLPKATFL